MSIMDMDQRCVGGVRVGIRCRAGRRKRGMARGSEEQVLAGTDLPELAGSMSTMDRDRWGVSGLTRADGVAADPIIGTIG
jgi:hypothetical protein